MSKYKICVYAISENKEKFVDRWMDSIGEADSVVVVDTGSTDKTVEKLRSRGAVVFEEKIVPWRFDSARNLAISHIEKNVNICFALDLNEIVENNWRKYLENAWDNQCTQARYWYFNQENSNRKFIRENIHKNHVFKWVNPAFEVLQYHGNQKEKNIFIDRLTVRRLHDQNESKKNHLPLLELSAKENPNDNRVKFWLGREYIFNGKNDEGIVALKQHLELPNTTWNEERCASMRFIAKGYLAKQNTREALIWLYKATAECSTVREPWLDLANLGYITKNWDLAFFAAEKGLEIKQSTQSYLVESESWGYALEDYAAIACYWLGFYSKALQHAKNALNFKPNDERLKNNYLIINKALQKSSD